MKFKIALAVLFLSAAFVSCKKDKDEAPGIEGLWTGKYSSGSNSYPTNGYAFLFRKDGTVRVFNATDTSSATGKAEGTYTLADGKVTSKYTYVIGSGTYSAAATVNALFTFMEGTWGDGDNTTNGGRYFLSKN